MTSSAGRRRSRSNGWCPYLEFYSLERVARRVELGAERLARQEELWDGLTDRWSGLMGSQGISVYNGPMCID